MRARPRLRRTLVLVLAALTGMTACTTGRMTLGDVRLDEVERVAAVGSVRAGVRGLPRLESSLYQVAFERQLVRSLEHAGLFASVAHGDFADADVDLVLHVGKADLSVRRHVNILYFPVAFATATLYIWVGGPIHTDEQFYEVTLHGERPGGTALFDVHSRLKKDHWVNLYSSEFPRQQRLACRGPHAHRFMNDLVVQLAAKLRATDLASTDGAAGEQ